MFKKIFVGLCIFVAVLSLYGLMFVFFVKASEYLATSGFALKF